MGPLQAMIRASGINPIDRRGRCVLTPPDDPALVVAYLAGGGAGDLSGRTLDIRDPELRRRAGLPRNEP